MQRALVRVVKEQVGGEGMEGAGPSARVSSIEGGGGTSFRHSVPIGFTGACKVLKLVIHVASAQGGADS